MTQEEQKNKISEYRKKDLSNLSLAEFEDWNKFFNKNEKKSYYKELTIIIAFIGGLFTFVNTYYVNKEDLQLALKEERQVYVESMRESMEGISRDFKDVMNETATHINKSDLKFEELKIIVSDLRINLDRLQFVIESEKFVANNAFNEHKQQNAKDLNDLNFKLVEIETKLDQIADLKNTLDSMYKSVLEIQDKYNTIVLKGL